MDSFTSAAITGLLFRVIERVDPDLVAGIDRPDPMVRATMPDTEKRVLIGRVLKARGPGMLLGVGQHLDLADETPVLAVLLQSTSAETLAEKYMRLERYYHEIHHTQILAGTGRRWSCVRESRKEAATLGENCLIAGLLLGLLENIGMHDCRLITDGRSVGPENFSGLELSKENRLDRFVIEWTADSSRKISETDAMLMDQVNERLVNLLAADIGRSWKLPDAASHLAFSERSLQRHLASEGRNFSSVLRQARMRKATELLARQDTTLTEIGYCCGYADQAHFQRDFQRAVNMTPKMFRILAESNSSSVSNSQDM